MAQLWISPSKLERYRCYVDGEYNGKVTEMEVINSIKGLSKYTPQANIGTAYHALIEHGGKRYYNSKYNNYYIKEGDMPSPVILSPKEAMPALEYRANYPLLKHENWNFGNDVIENYSILFLMRVDGIFGLDIHEVKTSQRPPDEELYFRSCQWKLYLKYLPEANLVQYNHFHYFTTADQKGEFTINPSTFKLYRYRGINDEITTLLSGFISFAQDHRLMDYLDSTTRKQFLPKR